MKTAKSLALSLVITIGFSSPLVLAGEPNTEVFGNEQPAKVSENNSRAMSGDCGPDLTYVDDPRAD